MLTNPVFSKSFSSTLKKETARSLTGHDLALVSLAYVCTGTKVGVVNSSQNFLFIMFSLCKGQCHKMLLAINRGFLHTNAHKDIIPN
jgi:hypothetical protein